ncbi:1-acyl-sn-glycerol-3-phosphate acyltransferase [Hahella sp. NBU794]|uniref:1-acyl-sn-glycerol-3-phosphate acyltransferase n=1 Tax=Hahella sp. NBU794 TaxID=3422590 RepID=UPI003D6DC78A
MSTFDDIRPYRDDEVPQVISRLRHDEQLVRAIEHYKFPRLSKYCRSLTSFLVRRNLQHNLRRINTIHDVQDMVAGFMTNTVRKTTSGFTYEGLDKLPKDRAFLFISNHRDIAMDPALVNFALYQSGRELVEIAIGDNLLSNPLVSDIMRLNRSFTVKRSVEGHKAKLQALTQLSAYIDDTLSQNRSIWIAQREGRAKNGLDKTDPAIIKMLNIYGRKQGMAFGDTIKRMNIVPVSISYEYDPCDLLKAKELQAREQSEYVKGEGEDIASIIRGISCPKGRVHIAFGEPLQQDFEDAEEVAAAIDRQITRNYKLFPSNILAFEQLKTLSESFAHLQEESLHRLQELAGQARQAWDNLDRDEMGQKASEFSDRVGGYPNLLQRYILEMYANPLINKFAGAPGDSAPQT